MADQQASPRVETRYQIANALGRLNADRPFLAKRVTQITEYAKTVRFVLNAIDGWQDRSGEDLVSVVRHIKAGRIEVRCIGNRIVVVTPG